MDYAHDPHKEAETMAKVKSISGIAIELVRHYSSHIGALILVLIGFVVTYQFVEPSPPRELSIATGSDQGAYYATARAYATY